MLRYRLLLQKKLDPDTKKPLSMRDLAKELGMPVPSLHNYVMFDVLPRIENVGKMAHYFGESIASLFSEDDDMTTELVTKIRHLSPEQKKKLLKEL
jgi:transcriptional regulator with XRE-family HTH domain